MIFKRIKEMDAAFNYVKRLAGLAVICSAIAIVAVVYRSATLVSRTQDKIYVISGGKAFQALATDRTDNILVEAKDHVSTFHKLFFTLSPDDRQISANIGQALYLADHSAKRMYDDLRENGFYTNIVSGNVDQRMQVDSVTVDASVYPYPFKYFGTQTITRPTSVTVRQLVTTGQLREVPRGDNNSHGFLIEQWRILENHDLKSYTR